MTPRQMASGSARHHAALVLSGGALLSFLARTFIDYRFVYAEINLATGALATVTLFNLLFFGGWIWALVDASHGRRPAMFALLAYGVLLVVFGVATILSFCPTPCQTFWPVGEIVIWSNVVIGVPAVALAAMTLFPKPGPSLETAE